MRKRLFTPIIIVTLVVSMLTTLAITVPAQSATCKDSPTVTINRQVDTAGDYAVWVLLKKDSATATASLSINNGSCIALGVPGDDSWQWVQGPDTATIRSNLSMGSHSFAFSSTSGTVLFDKVLATSNLTCIPIGDASNCLEEPLDVAIEGVYDGDSVTGTRKVSTVVFSKPTNDVTVRYLIDGTQVLETSTEPYCLAGSTAPCDDYDFSGLSNGEHTIQIIARSSDQESTKSVVFTKSDVAMPTPEVVVELPGTNNPATALPPIDFTVSGITDKETVSGSKIISATVNGVPGASVRFTLNGSVLNTDYDAPYCAIRSTSECLGWDSKGIENGSYLFTVTAAATGYRATEKTYEITVSNTSAPVSGTTTSTQVIVGAPTQQVAGTVRVNIPAGQVQPNSTVTYSINGQTVGEATGRDSATTIDTSKVPNGTQKITATINKSNGQVTTVSGDVVVRNDFITATSNWIRDNFIIFSIGSISLIGIVIVGIRFIVQRRRTRQLIDMHNLADTYTYIQPQEQVMARQLGYGLASIVLLFTGVFGLMRVGTIQAAPGFGFVSDIEEEGTGDFTLDYTTDMSIRFARVEYRAASPTTPTTPTPPSTPTTPTTPTAPTTPTTPTTPTPPASNGPATVMHPASGGFPTHNLALPRPAIGQSGRLVGPASYQIGFNGDGSIDGGAGNGVGAFRTWCYFSHMGYNDPLVKPDQPGASHLHTFFGNTSIDAFTKNTKTGASSTCRGGSANQSGYWVPTIIDASGQVIIPDAVLVYYKRGYQGVPRNDLIQVPPAGLKMIAGNASATTQEGHVNFVCMSGGVIQRPFQLGNCYAGGTQQIGIDFPQCWDGVNLESPNFKSHMAYGQYGLPNGCPASHPIPLPNITMNVYFNRALNERGSSNGWRFVTDNYSGNGGWSMHGDWWNGWDQDVLTSIVNDCIRTNKDCATDQLGDGQRALYCNRGFRSPDDNNGFSSSFICQ